MKRSSIKKDYIYSLFYHVLSLGVTLTITPYIARVFEADGVGRVSFAESIVSYFVLFAGLGITGYGQRAISYVQDDIEKRSISFWNIKLLQIISTAIALISYLFFINFQQDALIYLLLSLNIFAVAVDVTWFFQGMQAFRTIVFKNSLLKVLNLLFIFVFVHSKDDIYLYVAIISGFTVLSNFSLWISLPRYIQKPAFKNLKPLKELRGVLLLFLPTIATQVYTVLDKTMIGVITQSSFENGYYEQAIMIAKMALASITSLGAVMMPRIGNHYSKGETEIVQGLMYRSYRFSWLLSLPLCFGLIGLAPILVPWYFGDGYEQVIPLLSILSILIISIGNSTITGSQYLVMRIILRIFMVMSA